jgi:hypothetical protein
MRNFGHSLTAQVRQAQLTMETFDESEFEPTWLELFKRHVNGSYELNRIRSAAGKTVWDVGYFCALSTNRVRLSCGDATCNVQIGGMSPFASFNFSKHDFERGFVDALTKTRNKALEFKRLSFHILPEQGESIDDMFPSAKRPIAKLRSSSSFEFDGGAFLMFNTPRKGGIAEVSFNIQREKGGTFSRFVTPQAGESISVTLFNLFSSINKELDDVLEAISLDEQ